MQVSVNGLRPFFDVDGAKPVSEGPCMRERPTVVLPHGGPSAHHSHYRPPMTPLAEVAQLGHHDHRGNGSSDAGAQEHSTLAPWGDDVRAFCDTFPIEQPVPLGSPQADALARRRLIDGDTSREVLDDWLRHCVPHHSRTASDLQHQQRGVRNTEATRWFSRADGKGKHLDLRDPLRRIELPVLLMGGTLNPMVPVENQREFASLLPTHLVGYEEFEGAGHGWVADAPEHTLTLMRDAIALEETA